MKANEFVQKFGWSIAAYCVEYHIDADGIMVYMDHILKGDDIANLKRLVESYEIVKDFYGLAKAKEYAESKYTAPEVAERLKQAIADVESVESLKEMT